MPTMPQHILLAGATGLAGKHLLDRLLSEPSVMRIVAPTSTPLAEHPRLDNPQGELTSLLPQLSGPVEIAFCCLGSTRAQASTREEFHTIDHDLVLAFSRRARELSARHLLVISSQGANPHSPVFYNRTKGAVEEALKAQGWPQLTIARPAQLLGPRSQFRLVDRLTDPLLRWAPDKYRGIDPCALARALWRLALEESEGVRVVESEELHRLGK